MSRTCVVAVIGAGLLGTLSADALAAEVESSAAQPTNVSIIWHIDLAGVSLGKLGLTAALKDKQYQATSWLETRGIVNVFWESRIDADSRGIIEAGRMVPESYNSDYKGTKSTQKVALAFAGGFPAKLVAVPEYDLNRFPVTEEQKEGTVDPLSGMILAIAGVTVTPESPCGTSIPIFDGRRRYNVNLAFRHQVNVDDGKHGYRGAALECALEYQQIAGFKPQLDPQGRSMPKVYAWLAPVRRVDDPSKQVYMPIKIWAETAFGTATAMARHLKVNDAVPQSSLAAAQTANPVE